jgi:hypothetical protein
VKNCEYLKIVDWKEESGLGEWILEKRGLMANIG